ncbi:MAG: hypothetical protein ACOX9C_00310 [Kiritimatiellia bacterium]|jgi:hypothetical protein
MFRRITTTISPGSSPRSSGTVPDGHAIVVMQHVPVIDVAGNSTSQRMYRPLRLLLEAYQSREVFETEGFSCDFSDARGWIVCNITGHHHGETQAWCKGVLHLSEPCDASYLDYRYRSAFCGQLPEKKEGTFYEQTFGIVQFNPKNRRVHVTRVGGGQDRALHVDAVETAPGRSVQLKPVELKDVADWVFYDGDYVKPLPNPDSRWNPLWECRHNFGSVDSNGVFTAGDRPGRSIVMARDARLNKEVFFIWIR